MLPTSKLWALLLLLAVLAAGFAGGAGWSRWAHRRPRPEMRGREGYAARLAQQLHLDSAQTDSVRAALARYRAPMQETFETIRPRMDSLRHAMREEIRAMLTDAQRVRYDSLLAQERAMRERAMQDDRKGRN
jgi:hypothetical protein